MPTSNSKRPMNWEDYEYGRSSRQGSVDSQGSHVQFDAAASPDRANLLHIPQSNDSNDHTNSGLRHRRSSLSVRINSLAQAGGPNSLENFARSWTRAAGFVEIPPSRPSFILADPEDEPVGTRRSGELTSPGETRSLLRQQLERQDAFSEAILVEEHPQGRDEEALPPRDIQKPTLEGPPFASSYGGTYGSLSSGTYETSTNHAGEIYHEQQGQGYQEPYKGQNPLLVKVVEQKDGKRVQIVIGQSTLPQTVFNSVNVLIGVGLLSLPLGVKQSGWLIGMVFLFLAAMVTRYTAGLLAKCLDVETSLISFSDIAWKAFGQKTRVATGLLFSFELVAACVALVVLFADSLDALIPGWGIVEWKVLCGIILVPLSFVPLRWLSITSVLGILSCLGIVILIFVDGVIKPHSPGSLREPMMASAFPERWSTLPLSFGLLMSPWGGHSVFPNVYRDMRHPRKYAKAINYTYVFTYLLDLSVAVSGFLMFGSNVSAEITSNIFLTKGYPHAISVCIVIFIAIIPLTKIPLNARPIFVTLETVIGVDARTVSPSSSRLSSYTRGFLRGAIRILILVVIILLAVLVHSFDTVMALLGSAMAFSICIILPLAFHLRLFGKHISRGEKVLDWFLIVVCSVMAAVGTVWVFLPKRMRERMDGIT